MKIWTVPIHLLHPPGFRLHGGAASDEDLEPLVASIAQDGVSVIPVVRRLGGVLEILTERLVVRAAALAGLAHICVEVREGLSDRAAMRIARSTRRKAAQRAPLDRARRSTLRAMRS